MRPHFSLLTVLFLTLLTACDRSTSASGPAISAPAATVTITVDPHTTRSIAGESELDRKRYFGICDAGKDFDQRASKIGTYDTLVDDLNISFGRQLGVVAWPAQNPNIVREDPARPGFTDTNRLREQLTRNHRPQSPRFVDRFGPSLDVAAHGQHGEFPAYMGKFLTDVLKKESAAHTGAPKKPEHLPLNIHAAAELSAAILKYDHDDFTRPRFYEPVNEPHWSYLNDPKHIADWHLATMEQVHQDTPGVLVGGPCNSVGYFYSEAYRAFQGVRNFIDATAGRMDFYSFHVYDYHRWQDDAFTGSILSGLPLEGVLDLVPNYTSITYGKPTPIVISEHGGYASGDDSLKGRELLEKIASERFPGSGFEWEMKARSIHDFIHTNSIIANTLAFIDHPQTVKKAVPFILLEAAKWDPRYYATLYAPKDFDPNATEWKASELGNFYKLFRDIKGRRVQSDCSDPDIQLRTFADGNHLYLIAHNLSEKPETLAIGTPAPATATLRRHGRNSDLTPFLAEGPVSDLTSIPLGPLETIVLVASYDQPIAENRTLEETIHYGNSVTVPVESSAEISVATPEPSKVASATLRVGYNRPTGSGHDITILLNGTPVTVPTQHSASRYDQEKHGFSTTRIVSVDPSLLKTSNKVTLSFPDGGKGTIGSVVIRAAQ